MKWALRTRIITLLFVLEAQAQSKWPADVERFMSGATPAIIFAVEIRTTKNDASSYDRK
jgi:hypothetical protein